MVFLGDDINLGACLCLPFGDTGIQRLILLSTDKLCIQRDTIKSKSPAVTIPDSANNGMASVVADQHVVFFKFMSPCGV